MTISTNAKKKMQTKWKRADDKKENNRMMGTKMKKDDNDDNNSKCNKTKWKSWTSAENTVSEKLAKTNKKARRWKKMDAEAKMHEKSRILDTDANIKHRKRKNANLIIKMNANQNKKNHKQKTDNIYIGKS